MGEEMFTGAGGLRICLHAWLPEQPRAVLVIQHGLQSHGGRYGKVAAGAVAKGFAVYACDMRGRGKSEGERFYVDRIDEHVADLAQTVAIARARHPGLPVFVLGHSAGGLVACLYALDHQGELAGLICESFAYKVPVPEVVQMILKGIARLFPHAHIFKLDPSVFSRDPAVIADMKADPLIAGESQAARVLSEIGRGAGVFGAAIERFVMPLMILHGTVDKATSPSGSIEFHARAASKDKSLRIYEGHVHDLLADLGGDAVLAEILDWMQARI